MHFFWRPTCSEIHILNSHLSDVPPGHQPKILAKVVSDDPLTKSFGSICPTFLMSVWSSKQNYVLCFSQFVLGFLERTILQRILSNMHEKTLWKGPAKVEEAVFVFKEFTNSLKCLTYKFLVKMLFRTFQFCLISNFSQ